MAFRQLHAKLAAEGLFKPEHKRALPTFPRRIAFVTSPTGAAIHDFLQILRRRWQGVEILVIPTRVQGDGAAEEIVASIQMANRLSPLPDVLVVGRGGGSLEDLWCFNEETVVRAIFSSRVPVVSAVGHEIDVTLADLAADVRALTPSEAAERVVPSAEEMLDRLRNHGRRLVGSLRRRATEARSRLDGLATRRVFRRPHQRVRDLARGLDEVEMRCNRALRNRVSQTRQRMVGLAGRLESLSPLAVLARGYSLTWRTRDGQLIQDAGTLSSGEHITSRLAHGEVVSCVEGIHNQ